MKFSMIFEAQLAQNTPEGEQGVIRECLEQAVFGEEMGFDRIWAVEHHSLVNYAHMSAPEIFLSYVAARTSRVRIAHGVVCLPFKYNHPVRVAERAAMLDILSEGRVDVGVGRGATPRELGVFGVEEEETQPQLEEALRMLPGIWMEKEFSHESELISVPPREIIPKPVQEPHPPLFMACTKEATLNRAGELGVGALALGFAGPNDIAEKNKVYRAAVERRGDAPPVGAFANDHLSALCPAIVLDDAEKARSIGYRGQRFFVESLNHWSRGGPAPNLDDYDEAAGDYLAKERERLEMQFGSELVEVSDPTARRDAEQSAGLHLHQLDQSYGDVEDCITYVQRLIDAGADEIMFLLQMGTVPHEVIMESIENIGEHVIPHFRAREPDMQSA